MNTGSEVLTCRARGKFRKEGVSPLVGDIVDVRELAADIRKYLLDPGPFLQEYRSLCLTVGKTVTVHPVRGEPYEARAVEIDDRCRLVVESRRGVETLDSGEVSVRF